MRIAAILLEPRTCGCIPRCKQLAKIDEPEDIVGEGVLWPVAMPTRGKSENLLKLRKLFLGVVRRIVLRVLMFRGFCAAGVPSCKAILGTASPNGCTVLIIAQERCGVTSAEESRMSYG